nr:ABC transporter ATP-binding protein [Oceanococcus sp. HetDA_MAG_MS8]
MVAQTPLLQARGLRKSYAEVEAVRGVDLDLMPGVCFGLLGPNGAGKTTTIEILEKVLEPDAGEVLYKNAPRGAQFVQNVGIAFQATALQDYLTVKDQLNLFRSLYAKPLPLEDLVVLCDLKDILNRDSRKLSGGQRQRLLLALALVNDPDLVFLDEPTTGLDPQARRKVWELLEGIKARGKTILLSTHYMEEAYRLCDEVAIIDHGRIITQGSPQALLASHFDETVIALPVPASALPLDLPLDYVETPQGVEIITPDVDSAVKALAFAGTPLHGLELRSRTLEDLFIELTGEELRG